MLAGYIIGQAAAVFEKKHTTHIRDYGPEARGGACRADVVISDDPILYPYVDVPSILVSMSQQGYDKYCLRNCANSLMIIDEELVEPGQEEKDRVLSIPARRIADEVGRAAVANVVMVGFLTAVTDILSIESVRKSVMDSAPKNTEELNMNALERGYAYGLDKMKDRKAKK